MNWTRGFALFFGLAFCLTAQADPKWFDRSHDIFLTEDLSRQASHYRDYPMFWWNFLIIESTDPTELDRICKKIAALPSSTIRKLPCQFDLKNLQVLTQDWLRDLPRRESAPQPSQLKLSMSETLTKASMPMDRALVDLLRLDPLNSLQDLKARLEERMKMNPTLNRALLPLQFSFSPAESSRTAAFIDSLQGMPITYFGGHFSTLENETQIHRDVTTVSWIGALAMALLFVFVLATRRHRLITLVPLLAVSIAVTMATTVLVFGKIHGLTVAFGPGLVGLALDYGLHAAFLNPRSKAMWRSNHIGLLTSIAMMIVLGFSQIPLLRQLMFFASFGLCFSYFTLYLSMKWKPQWFDVQTYAIHPRGGRIMTGVSLLFLLSSILIFFRPIQLDVQHLNYESPATVKAREWFVRHVGVKSPYLFIEDQQQPLESSRRAKAWALEAGITYEGISSYLPDPSEQTLHLASWKKLFCAEARPSFSTTELKFFAPFLKFVECENLYPLNLGASAAVPDYLTDFHFRDTFVGLFFPETDQQIAALKSQYPSATTPREIFMSFPRIFIGELKWMVPLAVVLALIFLFAYYRHLGRATLAMVPFASGLGCYALMCFAFGLPISFISLVGLIMIFGFSLDYGIFVMDFLMFKNEPRAGVWSALSFCCFSTLAGFAPLVFAQHPVLKDLGHALLWGSLGTYVGSLWGVPWVYKSVWRA